MNALHLSILSFSFFSPEFNTVGDPYVGLTHKVSAHVQKHNINFVLNYFKKTVFFVFS